MCIGAVAGLASGALGILRYLYRLGFITSIKEKIKKLYGSVSSGVEDTISREVPIESDPGKVFGANPEWLDAWPDDW